MCSFPKFANTKGETIGSNYLQEKMNYGNYTWL